MKQLLAFVWGLCYMVFTIGLTLQVHYCMGKPVGLVWHAHEEKCSSCGMTSKKQKGCCKNEAKTFKTSTHAAPAFSFAIDAQAFTLPTSTFNYFSVPERVALSTIQPEKQLVYPPPLLRSHCSLYISIRNIRI